MTELGHLVYYVRDLKSSLAFYRDALGLSLSGWVFGRRGAVLTGGRTHHELMLIEVDAPPAEPDFPAQRSLSCGLESRRLAR